MKRYIRILKTGEVFEVHFYFADGVAYVGKNGIKFAFRGQYEELD